jgi:hypothetical protein
MKPHRDQEIQDAFRNGRLDWHSRAVAVGEWLRVNSMFDHAELSEFFRRNRNCNQFSNHLHSNRISHVCYDVYGRTPLKPTNDDLVGPKLEAWAEKRRRRSNTDGPIRQSSSPTPPPNATMHSRSDADETQSTRLSTAPEHPTFIYLYCQS